MTTISRQVRVPVDPTLKDVLDLFRTDLLQNLNCHHVGTIQSFDGANQLATATIAYTQTYFTYDEDSGAYQSVPVSYPVLVDCSVICLGGGNTSLTFPVQVGDECLILFNDRDLDNWYNGAVGVQVATPRLHAFSDAIILVGIRSSANALTNYDLVRAVLQNGSTLIGVGPSKVKIANASTTLNTLLQNLVTALETLCADLQSLTVICASAGSPSGVPINSSSFAAVSSTLSSIASELGGLLE